MEEEYRKSSKFHQYINIVESRVPCTPPTIQFIDDLGIHEFGISMSNVSIGLDQNLRVYILIRKVRVKRTRSEFATYKNKRHHRISADLLERKWGIGIDKAKLTIKSTTQDNEISALKTMTRRYTTDLLS